MRPNYDILWKGMIEEVIEDLLRFVEPGIDTVLDLEKGFQFLDKELSELYSEPGKPSGTRVVDKLVKVFLRGEPERWMLLHLEIQGNNARDFAKRMFEYYIRLFSKHGCPVAAIAILTGKDGKRIPAAFEDQCLWTKTRYEYKTLCITDYSDEFLAASANPFAAVVMIAKEALLQIKGTPEEQDIVLFEQKLLMARLLKKKLAIFGVRKTEKMLAFLNNYVPFKMSQTNLNFITQTDYLFGKKKNPMGIYEAIAEVRHLEGLEEGLKKGKEESVRLFLTHTKFSTAKIAELVGVRITTVRRIKKELRGK